MLFVVLRQEDGTENFLMYCGAGGGEVEAYSPSKNEGFDVNN